MPRQERKRRAARAPAPGALGARGEGVVKPGVISRGVHSTRAGPEGPQSRAPLEAAPSGSLAAAEAGPSAFSGPGATGAGGWRWRASISPALSGGNALLVGKLDPVLHLVAGVGVGWGGGWRF